MANRKIISYIKTFVLAGPLATASMDAIREAPSTFCVNTVPTPVPYIRVSYWASFELKAFTTGFDWIWDRYKVQPPPYRVD